MRVQGPVDVLLCGPVNGRRPLHDGLGGRKRASERAGSRRWPGHVTVHGRWSRGVSGTPDRWSTGWTCDVRRPDVATGSWPPLAQTSGPGNPAGWTMSWRGGKRHMDQACWHAADAPGPDQRKGVDGLFASICSHPNHRRAQSTSRLHRRQCPAPPRWE